MVPACSSDTLTNVLPHRDVMPQTQDITPHPVTVCIQTRPRHVAVLSIDLERHTHFNVLGKTRPGNPSPTFHTHQRTLNFMILIHADMVVVSRKLGRKCRTNQVLNPGPVVCEYITLSARPRLLLILQIDPCGQFFLNRDIPKKITGYRRIFSIISH